MSVRFMSVAPHRVRLSSLNAASDFLAVRRSRFVEVLVLPQSRRRLVEQLDQLGLAGRVSLPLLAVPVPSEQGITVALPDCRFVREQSHAGRLHGIEAAVRSLRREQLVGQGRQAPLRSVPTRSRPCRFGSQSDHQASR